jgi:enoyl-CoA hydratase/carnithine racemase
MDQAQTLADNHDQALSSVLRHDEGAVSLLTLNRPKARNALSSAMIARLTAHLDDIAADRNIKAVVVQAEGPVFSSGHDLKEMTACRTAPDGGCEAFGAIFSACAQMMQKIVALPQPVIAAVEGMATAAGCQLVASCDLAIASESAGFCTPGVHIGLFCSTPMVALSRNVAPKHAMEMLLLGDVTSPQQALDWGLVNRVVPPGQARAEALTIAKRIVAKSSLAVSVGKRAFYEQLALPLGEAYAHAGRVMIANMLARDAQEGIEAFMDKRDPVWQGR